MDISSIFQAVLDTKSDGAASSVASLKIGDQLTGRVLRLEADGRALIDMGGLRARAQMGFPVEKGQVLKLQVVQNGPTLHLQADVKSVPQLLKDMPRLDFTQVISATDQQQLLKAMDDIAGLPKAYWSADPSSERILASLNQIKSLFDSIPIDRSTTQLAQWLQGALEERGVLFEKKMADAIVTMGKFTEPSKSDAATQVRMLIARDLKPQLLMLKSYFGNAGAMEMLSERIANDDVEFVRQSVAKLLEHVVQQQERVVQNAREGDTFQVFTHMLAIEEQECPVQFKVYYPKRKKREKGSHHQHIAMLLQMDRLGPVRVDLAMAGRHLNVRFFVHNEEVQLYFEQNTKTLAKTLEGVFEGVVVATRVSEEKIRQFDQHQQDESPLGRIDIKA